MRHVSVLRVIRAAVPVLAVAIGACSYLPDPREVKLPRVSTFIPTNSNEFNRASVNTMRPVTSADLVDGQGLCPGVAPAASDSDAAVVDRPIRGVSLDMTECEVATALGPPQGLEAGGSPGGVRTVIMTYTAGDRPGIYRFVGGRLASVERGNEPPPPAPAAKKPPPKRQARPAQATTTTTLQ
jgi:hypothetical protein